MGILRRKIKQYIFCFKAVIPQFDNPPPRDLYNSPYHTTGEDNML